MKRRDFFKSSLLASAGFSLSSAANLVSNIRPTANFETKTAKNIIFMVSDGMSQGTLTMADTLKQRMFGKPSVWMELYRQQKVKRALMDMASQNSLVTDSAAASSSWGSGYRVPNGAINMGRGGIEYQPIWQKFMKAGKQAGIVTTVFVTHATPAGFCVNSDSRNDQEGIAEKYIDLNLKVIMGGGQKYFDPKHRSDKKDVYQSFRNKNYQIISSKNDFNSLVNHKPLLGLFTKEALPYEIDRQFHSALHAHVPTLKEMTETAIQNLKGATNGFVLQIEGGKVDWAAHANDAAALLYDQIAFDDAIETAIKFADENGETLVIITSDHGNANPGMMYGKEVTKNFDRLQFFKQTNEGILNTIEKNNSTDFVREIIHNANNISISSEQAQTLLNFYNTIEKSETGLYNYNNLPFGLLSKMQQEYHSVGWVSDNHTGDFVELAAYGPGSQLLKGFMVNTQLHHLLLEACEVTS